MFGSPPRLNRITPTRASRRREGTASPLRAPCPARRPSTPIPFPPAPSLLPFALSLALSLRTFPSLFPFPGAACNTPARNASEIGSNRGLGRHGRRARLAVLEDAVHRDAGRVQAGGALDRAGGAGDGAPHLPRRLVRDVEDVRLVPGPAALS